MSMNPMNQMTRMSMLDRPTAERLSANWWVFLVNGVLTVIAGILILSINWTLSNLAFFIGAVLIIRGILQLFAPPYAGVSRSSNIGIGIISALVGIAIIAFPSFAAFTLLVLAIFIGAFFIVSGVAAIVGSIANRATAPHWWLSLIAGILATVLGIFALYRPILTLAAAILVLGIWAIVVGTAEIALAFEIRRLPEVVEQKLRAAEAGRKAA